MEKPSAVPIHIAVPRLVLATRMSVELPRSVRICPAWVFTYMELTYRVRPYTSPVAVRVTTGLPPRFAEKTRTPVLKRMEQ